MHLCLTCCGACNTEGSALSLTRLCTNLQRYASDPQNTLKAYWPKISSFLKYKAEKLLVALQKAANEATDEDDDHARLHSRDLLVVAADYLEFLTAVQEGRAGPRVRSEDSEFLSCCC